MGNISSSAADEIMNSLYNRLLGRAPGEAEMKFWSDHLMIHPFDDTYVAFVSSAEYQNRHGVYTEHPAGHYYSPVVNPKLINKEKLYRPLADTDLSLLGISLSSMEEFWNNNIRNISSSAFKRKPSPSSQRFYLDNPIFSFADAIMLRAFMLAFRPQRIIEIGSGFSSAVMLDTIDEANMNLQGITFIEPYPTRLLGLLQPQDLNRVTILERNVQDVNIELFRSLLAGDILFIDSTHILKTQSDVCFELFEILPSLNPGVLIHFHDIFYPFEYPQNWIMRNNYSWNEMYALRSFLMYNTAFETLFFNHMFGSLKANLVSETCPLYLEGIGGSYWLRKK